ncbi:hypothetical protein GA0074704_1740 [Micromonospora siamensis]|uniref:Uncharacterized protein n=1 Tax=Micromonospora siamensis TaxID=299152 RepID=A0A1C5HHG2_9ACTN|nr:hypothetical protein GA0074704_1740 [Micromonospora siamensis]
MWISISAANFMIDAGLGVGCPGKVGDGAGCFWGPGAGRVRQ